jgi:uncharacterized protein YdaU (DUF1376 family)
MMTGPWHKRYHSDALTGYLNLTLEERGAYTTILDLLYDRGEPLRHNERLLAGYFGVSVRKARAMIAALVEKGKISVLGDGTITNRRFELERENSAKTSRKHAENGLKGARTRIENEKKHNENNEGGEGELKPIPDTRYQIPDTRYQIPDTRYQIPDTRRR